MNKNKINMLICVLITFIVLYFLKDKIKMFVFKESKNLSKKKYYEHILEWEGGISRNPNDSASQNPMPNSDIHTNKGIQWVTYVTFCEINNKNVNEQEFLEMPFSLWQQITDSLYWDKWNLDSVNCNNVAIMIHAFAYGFGNLGSEIKLANFIRNEWNVQDNDITKSEIIEHFNEYTRTNGCDSLTKKLIEYRRELIYASPLFDDFGNGWLNRLNSLEKLIFTS